MKKKGRRIPYSVWANSHLSVAKYFGGCEVNGVKYLLDYENCEFKWKEYEKLLFPDLVEVID